MDVDAVGHLEDMRHVVRDQHDGESAAHGAQLEIEHHGVRPGLTGVRRNLREGPRFRPGVAVTLNIEEPHQAIRRLPGDAIPLTEERGVRQQLRLGPGRLPRLATDPPDLGIFLILTAAAVVRRKEIAIGQLRNRGGVFVLAGMLLANDMLDEDVIRREGGGNEKGEGHCAA